MSGATHGLDDPRGYEIRINGHLDGRWSARFDGLRVRPDPDGTTVIECPAVDQAALHGFLRIVRDLGLPLISVTRLGEHQTADPPLAEPQTDPN